MAELRNALARGRDAWFASDEGLRCVDGEAAGRYLQNRLELAYLAGWAGAEAHRATNAALCGWVIGNGRGDQFRCWGDLGPAWTPVIDGAMQFARRCDAEQFAAEDEDAWLIMRASDVVLRASLP